MPDPSTGVKVISNLDIKAFGVDKNVEGLRHPKNTLGTASFIKANPEVCDLPFRDNTFDLLTCMMGTFAHFDPSKRFRVLSEFKRILRPDGVAVISTWDIECSHLSFLSMYSEKEIDILRRTSLKRQDVGQLVENCGFSHIKMIPFCMLPSMITYDLQLDRLELTDLQRLVEIDLAVRGTFPNENGEMVMLVGRKS